MPIRNNKSAYNIKTVSQHGFTLLELLIAISLSLVLTGVVIQSFLSNKETYRLTEGVSRVQENIRFGAHFISTDIRQAGNLGCIQQVRNVLQANDLFDLDTPIIGWDYNNTGIDQIDQTIELDPLAPIRSETNWSNLRQIPVPTEVDGLLVENSDIILIKKIRPTTIALADAAPGSNNAGNPILTTVEAHDFNRGQVMLVGDCLSADLTQLTNALDSMTIDVTPSTLVKPGTNYNRTPPGVQPWAYNWGANTTVYEFVSELYYIGKRDDDSPSSLYRVQIDGTGDNDPQELVEGIDSLQIIYGIDDTNSRTPNRFISADQIIDWSSVVSVRFSLLARSSDNTTDIDQGTNPGSSSTQETYRMLSHLDMQPNNGDSDNILRYVVNSTVQPRNTAIPDDLDFDICDANTTVDGVVCDALRIILQ